MDSNQVPLRGIAAEQVAEKERYILTKEDIDKVVHMVMEEGFSMEYAVKTPEGNGMDGTRRTTLTSGRLTNGSAEG